MICKRCTCCQCGKKFWPRSVRMLWEQFRTALRLPRKARSWWICLKCLTTYVPVVSDDPEAQARYEQLRTVGHDHDGAADIMAIEAGVPHWMAMGAKAVRGGDRTRPAYAQPEVLQS